MGAKYKVESTAPTMYINAKNQTVQGYIVYIQLTDYNELHEIRVPSLDTNVVKTAADKLLADRNNLASIGE